VVLKDLAFLLNRKQLSRSGGGRRTRRRKRRSRRRRRGKRKGRKYKRSGEE
jgi:hypothetical protein